MAYLKITRHGLRPVSPGVWEHPETGHRAIRQPDGLWRVARLGSRGWEITEERGSSSLRTVARRMEQDATLDRMNEKDRPYFHGRLVR